MAEIRATAPIAQKTIFLEKQSFEQNTVQTIIITAALSFVNTPKTLATQGFARC